MLQIICVLDFDSLIASIRFFNLSASNKSSIVLSGKLYSGKILRNSFFVSKNVEKWCARFILLLRRFDGQLVRELPMTERDHAKAFVFENKSIRHKVVKLCQHTF